MDDAPRDAAEKGRRAVRLTVSVAAAMLAVACASPGFPPGGPPDASAPVVLQVAPESGRVNVTPRNVVFRFDEVVSERPAGVTTLADLFVISPREGTPVVEWSRNEIAVRPRRGWTRNTVYTITLLPGLSDLRGNTRRTGVTTLFSTGTSIPRTAIRGTLFDWGSGRPGDAGLVEALAADSVSHIAFPDSAGMFELLHLAPGAYRVRGVIDGNRNRALDPREPWDSATVTLADSAQLELYAFVHDSIGPRIESVTVDDSLTLRIRLDPAMDPTVPPRAQWIEVTSEDSVRFSVAGVTVGREPERDRPATDTARTTAPVMARARPVTQLVVTLGSPLRPAVTYTVTATGIPGLLGRSESSRRTVVAPRTAPAAPPR